MGTGPRLLGLVRGAIAVLAAGWLAGGSCSVSYVSCTHDPGDCSAPKHERDCICSQGSSASTDPAPPRAIALEVEVDAAGRTHVRRWLLTERGPGALERADGRLAPDGTRAPFTTP
jgi:hypothetical protein